jgi:tyrosyl-tRNA synthetase
VATTATKANVLDVLYERGFVKDVSDEEGLRRVLVRPTTVYCGYDPTGTSLHVGNLISMMMLAWMQRYGHRPIVVLGGGTAMVGDPSGRFEERPILTSEQIQRNLEALRPQFERVIKFDAGALLLNNADWLLPLNLIEFLRDIGSRFSVNQMLSHETYRTRLERGGLSFLEFSYQLLQAYDFLHLYRQYGCVLQIGASDQWANILAGVDLIRRIERAEAFALVSELLTMAGGRKMSKSEGAAIWLSPELTSPYEYYQFWINVDDRDVERFLALFTFLPMDEVRRLASLEGAALRQAKEVLAFEATAIIHGVAAAEQARAASRALFTGEGPLEVAPTVEVSRAQLERGVRVADLLAEIGLVASKREARRVIEQGGVSVNGIRVTAADQLVTLAQLGEDSALLIRVGKKLRQRVRAV